MFLGNIENKPISFQYENFKEQLCFWILVTVDEFSGYNRKGS